MHAYTSRIGRWPLALTLALLGACADETTAPAFSAPTRPNAAAGDVYLVTTPNDDGSIGSLRWALKFTTGGETIRFDPGLAGQTIWVDSTIYLTKTVTIEGPATKGVTISGGGQGRMFMGNFPGTATFRNVALTGGNSGTSVGPVFYGEADLVVENSLVYGNVGAAGTVLYGSDKMTLTNTTVTGNLATNVPTQEYAAVQGDTVTLINSTIAYNGFGGAGTVNGRLTIRNSILANNVGSNCVRVVSGATVVREGANVSDDDKCGGPSDIMIADPKLATIADNGGPTYTHALMAGSPAINAGIDCNVAVDQRYMQRDAKCDLGAFEFADFTAVTLTVDPTTILKRGTGGAVLTGTIKCSRNETFALALELAQEQRVKNGAASVTATTMIPVDCTTTARMWSASMESLAGDFQAGAGAAKATTANVQKWVTPATVATAVKLFRSK